MVNLSEKEKHNALNEVRLLASIQDPFIIQYKEAFFDEASSSLCLIMEYADDGDLYQRIMLQKQKELKDRTFSEDFIWRVFIQIVKGLNRLH